jgi:C4-dicarboxylate-specific signal transduction histidine kinase
MGQSNFSFAGAKASRAPAGQESAPARSAKHRLFSAASLCLAVGLNSVRGDRVQLQQVVFNLILNSVEAMSSVERGARELSISTNQGPASDTIVAVQDSCRGFATCCRSPHWSAVRMYCRSQ